MAQDGRKRAGVWSAVVVATSVAVVVFYLAHAPRPASPVPGLPRLTAEKHSHLQEHAAAAFVLWQKGEGQEEAEPDEPANPLVKAANAAPSDDYDGLYTGSVTMRADGHLVTTTVRVTHGVGVGTQSRLDCGATPVSLKISSSGDVSGMMLVFSSTCLRTGLAIRGRAVPGTLLLRLGSQYVELTNNWSAIGIPNDCGAFSCARRAATGSPIVASVPHH